MSIPYTQNAREVLRLAQEAAKENGSGYVAKILKGDIPGAREAIEWYKSIFGDDYYLDRKSVV